jgi:hypothetical protein
VVSSGSFTAFRMTQELATAKAAKTKATRQIEATRQLEEARQIEGKGTIEARGRTKAQRWVSRLFLISDPWQSARWIGHRCWRRTARRQLQTGGSFGHAQDRLFDFRRWQRARRASLRMTGFDRQEPSTAIGTARTKCLTLRLLLTIKL